MAAPAAVSDLTSYTHGAPLRYRAATFMVRPTHDAAGLHVEVVVVLTGWARGGGALEDQRMRESASIPGHKATER
jgi:hypothetical protein